MHKFYVAVTVLKGRSIKKLVTLIGKHKKGEKIEKGSALRPQDLYDIESPTVRP